MVFVFVFSPRGRLLVARVNRALERTLDKVGTTSPGGAAERTATVLSPLRGFILFASVPGFRSLRSLHGYQRSPPGLKTTEPDRFAIRPYSFIATVFAIFARRCYRGLQPGEVLCVRLAQTRSASFK